MPDVVNTVNDKTVFPLETDDLDMSLSGFESVTNEKEMAVDMGIKEQLFKSKFTSPRAINTEEHMKVLHIARQPVDESKLILETNICHHILQIDLSEMLHFFWPVICPLTEHVMHMDKAGFLWPCGGCTNSGNWMYCHEIYCPRKIMRDCNPKIAMKDNPSNEVCIPIEFKDAYETFSYPELCKHSMSLFHAVARNCGGVYFNLKSVLGGLMLS